MSDEGFENAFDDMQVYVHGLAVDKGWWDGADTQEKVAKLIPEKIALIHSELSEALEEYRKSGNGKKPEGFAVELSLGLYYGNDGKPEGFVTELADAVIRIMDLCDALNLNLSGAIRRKHEYNKTRPFRHGGKKA